MVPSEKRKSTGEQLAAASDRVFVNRDEFCRLLLGHSRMDRADDPSCGLRGLRDTATGVLYVIQRQELNQRVRAAAT